MSPAMPRSRCALLLLAAVPSAAILLAQGRLPVRATYDDRLRAIEERLDAIEDGLARAAEERLTAEQARPEGLGPLSELKLDRLEVRVIQLEDRPVNCDCGGPGQRAVLERLISVERQLARLRARGGR